MRLIQRATAWSLALACVMAPCLAAAQAIEILGSKVPIQAIGFGSLGGSVTAVTPANPLPMICISGCSATGAGTATAAAPTRAEGQSYGLSFDLSGALRTTGGGGGGGGGGTEFAEDAPHVSGALGTFALVVRKDTAASLAGTDGDYSGLIVDANGRLHVNPGTVPVTGTFWQATQPVSALALPLPAGAATAALQAATHLTVGSAVAQRVVILDAAGNAVSWSDPVPLAAGSQLIGKVGIDQTTPGTTNKVNIGVDGVVRNAASTTGGCTPFSAVISTASTNSTLIAAGVHTLCSLDIVSVSTTLAYVRLYDSGAAPTCSSATGATASRPALPSGGVAPDLGPFGVSFVNGIALCITGGSAANDNTNATAGVFVNGSYK